jgi:hypothetical protein
VPASSAPCLGQAEAGGPGAVAFLQRLVGAGDALRAHLGDGGRPYPDKGNMTKAEIDRTMKVLIEAKRAGQFRAFWQDL